MFDETAMAMFSSLIDEIQDSTAAKLVNRQLKALTRMTDLFMAGSGRHSKEQIELFDEIFKVLVAAIELKTRIKLAQQLAAVPNTPGTLARALAFDSDIAVAGPVLSRSIALSDSDLAVNASTQSQDHLHAIARRQTISEAITEILIERGEPRVVHTVARNAGARISDDSFRELVVRAGEDASLALHIGMRRDIPRHHFLKLLEAASASVRTRIVAANPRFADEVRDAVTEVTDDISLKVRNGSSDHVKAKSRVKRLQIWKDLSETNVHAAARSQNFEQTALTLSALAGCPIEMAERAILNENPGVVQVIAKAAGCGWITVKALLLMRVADRRMSERDIDQARTDFERLETQTAKRVLEFYKARRDARSFAEPDISVKTIARGMPGESGVTVVTMLVCFFQLHTRLRALSERPAFPAPSDVRKAEGFGKTRADRAARSRSCILTSWRGATRRPCPSKLNRGRVALGLY